MAHVDPSGKAFPTLLNDCILRAARGEPTDFVPVWIMRQAGRYLPEFRELRSKHPFFEICETPDLACQVTLMPIKRFDLDAAIIFSDILIIPQALGMEVLMSGKGPEFPDPLKQDENLEDRLDFNVVIENRLSHAYKAISITRHALEGRCPLIGFSGAPWTLMCYMIEGGGSKTMSKAKKWLYQEPGKSRQLLDLLAEKVTDHLVSQVKSGAQLVQIFESNAEYLTLDLFREFALPQILKICSNFKNRLQALGIDKNSVPVIVFAKGGHYAMDDLTKAENSIDIIGLDWTMDPLSVRQKTNKCLQGNLDPCALYTNSLELTEKTRQMLNRFGTQNYIANLGHGIYPDADFDRVKTFIDNVHSISRQMNSSK